MQVTRKVILILSILFGINGCQWVKEEEIAAKVGEFEIYEHHVNQRNQIIEIYYNDEGREAGLKQLIKAYQSAQILENHGYEIDRDLLERESRRIESQSKMPEQLESIQQIFADQYDDYLKVYVLPVYVERTLYFEFFLKTPKFHKKSLLKAKNFLEKVKKEPSKFERLTYTSNLVYEEIEVVKKKEKLGDLSKAESPSAPPSLDWAREVAQNLGPGEVHDKVVDVGRHWKVIRKKQTKTGKKVILQTVSFEKSSFSKWYESQKSRVNVKVF